MCKTKRGQKGQNWYVSIIQDKAYDVTTVPTDRYEACPKQAKKKRSDPDSAHAERPTPA